MTLVTAFYKGRDFSDRRVGHPASARRKNVAPLRSSRRNSSPALSRQRSSRSPADHRPGSALRAGGPGYSRLPVHIPQRDPRNDRGVVSWRPRRLAARRRQGRGLHNGRPRDGRALACGARRRQAPTGQRGRALAIPSLVAVAANSDRCAQGPDRDDERLFEVAAADESYEAAVWGGDEQAGQLPLADPLE